MLKTPRRRGTEDSSDDDEVQHRQAKRAAPDAVWATELPTDLWKRCLDFAYGPATLCVDPLAPLKAAATLAAVSRGTQRAMADPGLWKDLARGSERCGCDRIVLAADVGGFGIRLFHHQRTGRAHPVEGLVRAAVRVHEQRSVALVNQQPGRERPAFEGRALEPDLALAL